MKKILILIFVILLNLFSLTFINASFTLNDYEIETGYAPDSYVSGWIDIDVDESSDVILKGFDNEITLGELLELNDLDEGDIGDSLILDLDGVFKVPFEKGDYDFELTLDNEEVFSEEIEVLDIPLIISISPKNTNALVETEFTALISGNQNLSYIWDFGNGDFEETDIEFVKYAYPETGKYNLTLTIENELGESSKKFEINVNFSKQSVISKINDLNSSLNKIEKSIKNLSYQNEIKNKIDFDNIKKELTKEKTAYEKADNNSEYLEIMNRLNEIEIPSSANYQEKIKNSGFIPDSMQIDLDLADSLVDTTSDYDAKIISWIKNNLNLTISIKEYYAIYDEKEVLFSYVDLNIIKKNPEKIYLVINKDSSLSENNIKFLKDYDEKENTDSFVIEITGNKEIEFLYPSEIEIDQIPVYILANLGDDVSDEIVCNQNGICEEELGEDYENCREDCKPIGKTIIYLFILLLIAFIIYIFLQEWYKRYYENRLFKNKNELFNLINFMNNAKNQGIDEKAIFDKLKKNKWKSEKINYAWRKLNGKRTGMWEIPIFKWLEKRKVAKELMKREQINKNRVQKI